MGGRSAQGLPGAAGGQCIQALVPLLLAICTPEVAKRGGRKGQGVVEGGREESKGAMLVRNWAVKAVPEGLGLRECF